MSDEMDEYNNSNKQKFHRKVDELICNWSLLMNHSFSEQELNSLVDLLGNDFQSQAIKIHAHGVHIGKRLMEAHVGHAAADEGVAELVNAAKAVMWINECRCHTDWTSRGMHESNSLCGELDGLKEALKRWEASRGNKS